MEWKLMECDRIEQNVLRRNEMRDADVEYIPVLSVP